MQCFSWWQNSKFYTNSALCSALQRQHGFPLWYSCGKRRRQNWSVCIMLNPSRGNVKTIYVEQQRSLAEDCEQTVLRWIITRWHLNTPHHKVMSSPGTHIWYCWWVHISLTVYGGCFPISNVVEIRRAQVLHNSLQGWGWFWSHIQSGFWVKICSFRGHGKDLLC